MKFPKDYWFETALVIATALIIAVMAVAMGGGCAHVPPPTPPNPTAHPIQNAEATVTAFKGLLTALNVISVLAFIAGVAALFYAPLAMFSKLLLTVGGAGTVTTLIGLIAIPFIWWIIGAIVIGVVGYEAYVNGWLNSLLAYFKKPAAPAPKA